ncbi:MAG: MOSC domain-containing protein [Holophagaceae bacterium]|nr:MOSC domain-containing protein [Holophagaceae bacterium]
MQGPAADLVQIRVGKAMNLDASGSMGAEDPLGGPWRPWRSAIFKTPVACPRQLTRLGLAGDEVADTRHHGGPDQAVLAYASEHYPLWQASGLDADPGAFGENFLLAGLTDQEACIGDVFAIGKPGGAVVQISHPRQPCATLARRFQRNDVVLLVWETARGGWYLRVLQEGQVQAGDGLALLERPNPGWSVARVLNAFRHAKQHPEEALLAADLSGLTGHWSSSLREKATL